MRLKDCFTGRPYKQNRMPFEMVREEPLLRKVASRVRKETRILKSLQVGTDTTRRSTWIKSIKLGRTRKVEGRNDATHKHVKRRCQLESSVSVYMPCLSGAGLDGYSVDGVPSSVSHACFVFLLHLALQGVLVSGVFSSRRFVGRPQTVTTTSLKP